MPLIAEAQSLTREVPTQFFFFNHYFIYCESFPGGASGQESASQCRRHNIQGFNPWVQKIPWRKEWQPTPVFLPGESQGERSLVDYDPLGHKESDTTEATYQASDTYRGVNKSTCTV